MYAHTFGLSMLLLLATSVFAFPSLERRAPGPDNPTGINVLYQIAWIDPTTGKFGGNITFAESVPAATPTVFSIKFYFSSQQTTITDYWGDWKVTHYQSGAFHMQPGTPQGPNNSRSYQFNGLYNVAEQGANVTFAQPAAMSLLHGPNYEDKETAFQRDDIVTPDIAANLPKEPFGPFVRDAAKPPSPGDLGPATGASANQNNNNSGPTNSNLPMIIGAIAGIVVVGAAIAVFVAVRRNKKDPSEDGKSNGVMGAAVTRNASHKGQVQRDAVLPHVEQTGEMRVVASEVVMPVQYSMPDQSHYYDENGCADTESAPGDQMAFVEQYAPQPGYHYAEVDEVEGDDYNLHQHMVSAAQIAKEGQGDYYHAGEYGQMNANGDYFFAEEVMDRSETSQAVAIDHEYVTQAIGYHQAQIEQRIQQDLMMDQPSPMLTLTHADGGEQLYLQEDDYYAYDADAYGSPVSESSVTRKDSGAKRAPGKNYI